MPIYEYECEECGRRIELLQKMGEEPPRSCECGAVGKMVRLLSASAIQFKGEGWYVTDYAGKGKVAEEKREKETTDKETKAEKGKEVAKPLETKSEAGAEK